MTGARITPESEAAAERAALLRRLDAAAGDPIGRDLMGGADLAELRDFVARVERSAAETAGMSHIQAMWDLDSREPAIRRVPLDG